MERIQAGDTDEIIISDDSDSNEDEVREINAEFVQDNRVKGIKRSFRLFNKRQLLQSLQNFKNKKGSSYRIDLRYVRQVPVRRRQLAWRCLITSGVTMVCAIVPVAIWYNTEFKSNYLWVAASLLLAAAIISLLLFFYRSSDTYVYKSIASGIPLIELENRKPSQREFEVFSDVLESYIRKAQDNGMTVQQRLAAELKDIRRLKEAGMLSEATYAEARTLIFSHKDFSAT